MEEYKINLYSINGDSKILGCVDTRRIESTTKHIDIETIIVFDQSNSMVLKIITEVLPKFFENLQYDPETIIYLMIFQNIHKIEIKNLHKFVYEKPGTKEIGEIQNKYVRILTIFDGETKVENQRFEFVKSNNTISSHNVKLNQNDDSDSIATMMSRLFNEPYGILKSTKNDFFKHPWDVVDTNEIMLFKQKKNFFWLNSFDNCGNFTINDKGVHISIGPMKDYELFLNSLDLKTIINQINSDSTKLQIDYLQKVSDFINTLVNESVVEFTLLKNRIKLFRSTGDTIVNWIESAQNKNVNTKRTELLSHHQEV